MPSRRPATHGTHRRRTTVLTTVIVAGAALASELQQPSAPSPTIPASSSTVVLLDAGAPGEAAPPAPARNGIPPLASPSDVPPASARTAELGIADGLLPDDVTVFDQSFPAVANLDPTLLAALRAAASAAAGSGVRFTVASGWRSTAYQSQLFRDAVEKYGSDAQAARWVAPAQRSAHVSGDAIDIEHAAAAWLAQHGSAFGLCQIYENEPWHFELRPDAVLQGCPARYADPTHDPRMQ